MALATDREISCKVTKTLLLYVRENNNGSLGALLEGLELGEAYLSDPNNWVSHAFLQTLYDRMIAILGDENAVYHMALGSDRLQSLGLLNRIVRLLGNPHLIYSQSPIYNRLLKLNGDVLIHDIGDSWALLEDRYYSSDQKTRYDCDYTRGILEGIPTLFGMPMAQVEEIECQVAAERYGKRFWNDAPRQGSKGCLYRVQWDAKKKPNLWSRILRLGIYWKAIEDLLEANQKIQEKYDEVRNLASNLQRINRELEEARHQQEADLKKLEVSESRYRLLAENISDIIWTLGLENMRFTYISPSVEKIRGFTPQEAMALSVEETLTPQSLKDVTEALSEAMAMEGDEGVDPDRSRTMVVQQVCKDGSYTWGEMTVTFLRDRDGRPVGVLGVTRDINQRRQAEERLKQNEERLRLITNNMSDIITMTDLSYVYQYISPSYKKVLGYDPNERVGKGMLDNMHPDDRVEIERAIAQALSSGVPGKAIHRYRHADGHYIWLETVGDFVFDESAQLKGGVFTSRDITERKKAEDEQERLRDQLLHSRKLEAVGTLAGGIAHDFNNLLMGIQGHASLMLAQVNEDDPQYEQLKGIEDLVINGADLTKQLLGFARKGRYDIRPADMNELVRRTSGLFGRTKREIVIHTDYGEALWPVEVDRGQIENVLLNLFVNAWQAMPMGGELYIGTQNVVLDRKISASYGVAPGKFVQISVRDIGVGMDKETMARVFEPFFTTKEMGRGTGLGLASVYGIVRAHQGFVVVDSKKGEGTTFDIFLPASEKEIPVVVEKKVETSLPGDETILLVDDDERVIEVASQMLTRMGYTVHVARGGTEALEIYERYGKDIRLVILDMIMPVMGGGETYDRLKKINPQLKAILSSGYSIDGQAQDILDRGCQAFLQKPFTMRSLSEAMRNVLGDKR